MSKKDKKPGRSEAAAAPDPAEAKKARNKAYEKEIARLQVEIAHLQAWVKATGARIVIIFEGRDAAGKGGMIKRLDRAGQPARVPRRRAAGAERPREDPDLLPALHGAAAGGRRGRDLRPLLVQPPRRRAGHGLCHRGQGASASCRCCPHLEGLIIESGIMLLKYFLDVSEEEQERRFRQRIDDPVRQWKLSPMDLESYRRWWDYTKPTTR